ncbi:hypothetical protein DFJ43DRAFT_1153666 [Lentinula guzmanii]|uniref:Uncharacterized protein n=1 Tax=Lentinula guzmanii TaxID=2804957 RepID=A0AA38N0M9_9AGAR|nr:hypothetical protein DFJ43DRAFT_1153666 [Lentinula guzmanii]
MVIHIPIPRQILDCIPDNLHSHKATLLNCALAGKAWSFSAQRGIFYHITFVLPASYIITTSERARAYDQRNEQLVELYERKPFIASYVRNFELREIEGILNYGAREKETIRRRLGSLKDLTLQCSLTLVFVEQSDDYSPVPPYQTYSEQQSAVLSQLTINPELDHHNVLGTYRWDEWITVDTCRA